ELYVKKVADAAVLIVLLIRTVELEVNAVLSRGLRRFAEFEVLGKTNAVGCCEDPIEADLFRIRDRVEKIRRERRLASRKKDDDLAFRLERHRAVEDRLDVIKRRFVNITDLIRVHKARIAHHIAAIRKIDRQHRSAAGLEIASCVVMNVPVLGRAEITPEE